LAFFLAENRAAEHPKNYRQTFGSAKSVPGPFLPGTYGDGIIGKCV
jgi:hypothetical protein